MDLDVFNKLEEVVRKEVKDIHGKILADRKLTFKKITEYIVKADISKLRVMGMRDPLEALTVLVPESANISYTTKWGNATHRIFTFLIENSKGGFESTFRGIDFDVPEDPFFGNNYLITSIKNSVNSLNKDMKDALALNFRDAEQTLAERYPGKQVSKLLLCSRGYKIKTDAARNGVKFTWLCGTKAWEYILGDAQGYLVFMHIIDKCVEETGRSRIDKVRKEPLTEENKQILYDYILQRNIKTMDDLARIAVDPKVDLRCNDLFYNN